MPNNKRQEASPVLYCPLCHCTIDPAIDPEHPERCPFPVVARFGLLLQRDAIARQRVGGASGHP
jgi:hypothetical protein